MKKKRDEAVKLIDLYRSKIIDIDGDSIVFEIIGTSVKIDEAINLLKDFGLTSVSRTGIAAGFKGRKRLDESN